MSFVAALSIGTTEPSISSPTFSVNEQRGIMFGALRERYFSPRHSKGSRPSACASRAAGSRYSEVPADSHSDASARRRAGRAALR